MKSTFDADALEDDDIEKRIQQGYKKLTGKSLKAYGQYSFSDKELKRYIKAGQEHQKQKLLQQKQALKHRTSPAVWIAITLLFFVMVAAANYVIIPNRINDYVREHSNELRGPKGERGQTGAQGEQGAQGSGGARGATGTSGSSNTNNNPLYRQVCTDLSGNAIYCDTGMHIY